MTGNFSEVLNCNQLFFKLICILAVGSPHSLHLQFEMLDSRTWCSHTVLSHSRRSLHPLIAICEKTIFLMGLLPTCCCLFEFLSSSHSNHEPVFTIIGANLSYGSTTFAEFDSSAFLPDKEEATHSGNASLFPFSVHGVSDISHTGVDLLCVSLIALLI